MENTIEFDTQFGRAFYREVDGFVVNRDPDRVATSATADDVSLLNMALAEYVAPPTLEYWPSVEGFVVARLATAGITASPAAPPADDAELDGVVDGVTY